MRYKVQIQLAEKQKWITILRGEYNKENLKDRMIFISTLFYKTDIKNATVRIVDEG